MHNIPDFHLRSGFATASIYRYFQAMSLNMNKTK